MMFAVTLPVLLTAVGAAIDYSRAVNARSAMQAAVDATALMISKEASSLNPEEITTKAHAYFNALYTHSEVADVSFNATYTPNAGNGASVEVIASGSVQTDFMKFASITDMPINVASTTKWGNIRYRIALALDNTGSMSSASKMEELKKAANKLIGDFYDMATTNEDVYISIVPFARDVNIGTDKKDANWIRWTEWDNDNKKKVCTKSQYTTKRKCEDNGGTWNTVTAPHTDWNGCVMDRDQDFDTTNTPPDPAVTATMIPAWQSEACPTAMIGMTSVKASKQTLLDKISAMRPNGSTNQGIGMFWAWLTHANAGPFPTPSKDSTYVYQDVIILLTDGLNTENRYDGDGRNHSTRVDARQALLCTNARAQGIKIFAIQVATDRDPVSTVTKNCASEPDNPNYFSHITQASQMTVKFQNIFKELAKLRVAK
ncbi:pilus assembly protein [Bradyrhizobium sp. LHD-71]|uniref:pilus assembly protein n=1 Tax=Bradyrhizobium sp. LHD-71 TaxID=3072141 RepID=UPI00280FF62E|nr:pilus assembly protein [Bradyrhizobium sp. LHD-71]MDQ8726289.1 pilus assembly protein [Bradyrhizobium sp. LHD-71]